MAFKNITYILALWSLKQCAAVRTNPKNELRTKMISFPEIFNNIVLLNFCYDL